MPMIRYPAVMAQDPIVLFRHTATVSAQGAHKRTFTTPGVSLMASVQVGQPARTDASGRTIEETPTVIYTDDDPEARPDDKIVWMDRTGVVRTYAVESRSVPRGIGDVTWSTKCLESK
jgi:hypothetical protein